MDYVKRVYSQPNARSLKEGEEVVYLGKGKPLARYRKEGGQVWVSYMSTDGNLYVDKDFNVQGTINQGGTGGTGKPVVKGGLVPMTAGGMGANISANTGTMYIASAGTVSTGTLPVNQGGTAVTANTTWVNSNITTSADGTLNYDGTTAVAPSLPDISGTLTVAKGGTGETDNNTWLNSRVTTNANGTLNYDATTAAAPDIAQIGGTLTVAKGGTGATDSNTWLNSRVEMNTNGTLNYSANGSGNPTMDTLTDDNNIRARVTGSLASGNGLNTGVAIGDSVKGITIFNESIIARPVTDDSTTDASDIWWQTDDTPVIKCIFNYVHDTDNKTMKCSFLLRSGSADSGKNAIIKLAIYDYSIGGVTTGSVPDTGADKVTPVTVATNRTTFSAMGTTSAMDISGLSAGIYKVAILLYNEDSTGGTTSYLTGPVVIVYGS